MPPCGGHYPRVVQHDREDDAWRAIVENYGDRADLGTPGQVVDSHLPDQDEQVERVAPAEPTEPVELRDDDDIGGFVPAEPDLPPVAPDRLAAWIGLFGSPAVLLLATVLGLSLPGWLGYVLVAAFIGGFGYLVAAMPPGPRDPGDDGARL